MSLPSFSISSLSSRSLKAIVLLLVLFVSSLLMVVVPLRANSATKPGLLSSLTPAVNAQVPTRCPDLKTSVRIIDSSSQTGFIEFSNPTTNDPNFIRYVKDISEGIFAKVREMPQCTTREKPRVELFFVYRSLISYSPLQIDAMRMDQPKPEEVKYLDSPWAKIAIGYSPDFFVRGVFFWNVQQLFRDQAMLSSPKVLPNQPLAPISVLFRDRALLPGVRVLPNQSLAPISVEEYKQYEKDYLNSVANIIPVPENFVKLLAAEKRFAESVPAEIFWFFKMTGARRDLSYFYQVLCEKILPNYVDLNQKLFDRLSTSGRSSINYKNILELKDLIDLKQYHVKSIY
jgi:hypothetical protein